MGEKKMIFIDESLTRSNETLIKTVVEASTNIENDKILEKSFKKFCEYRLLQNVLRLKPE
jgi:hypothetical protein